MAGKKNEEIVIEIKPIEKKVITLKLVGDTPLIMHAWSEKAKRMMLEAQQGKSKGKAKAIKNPVADFIESMYWATPMPEYSEKASEEECEKAFEKAIADGAMFYFPATAIKQAGNSAAYRLGWIKNQAGVRGAYFIKSQTPDGGIIIHSDTPIMREDMVRIGNGNADIRYRGELRNWWAEIEVEITQNSGFTLENIINIMNAGGTICGIGEWRPEKDGDYGRYHVEAV